MLPSRLCIYYTHMHNKDMYITTGMLKERPLIPWAGMKAWPRLQGNKTVPASRGNLCNAVPPWISRTFLVLSSHSWVPSAPLGAVCCVVGAETLTSMCKTLLDWSFVGGCHQQISINCKYSRIGTTCMTRDALGHRTRSSKPPAHKPIATWSGLSQQWKTALQEGVCMWPLPTADIQSYWIHSSTSIHCLFCAWFLAPRQVSVPPSCPIPSFLPAHSVWFMQIHPDFGKANLFTKRHWQTSANRRKVKSISFHCNWSEHTSASEVHKCTS